jgi:uncharacterized membrane protein YdjX (TVP38/TMEM64 family)
MLEIAFELRPSWMSSVREGQILGIAVSSFLLLTFSALASPGQAEWSLQATVQQVLTQIQALGGVGVLAFIALYALATVAFVPGSLLTLGAGVVYGLLLGSLYVLIGASLGALLAFLAGRYLARNWVAKQIEANPKFKAIDAAVGREGFKIVLLTRLSPVFPFNLLNYAFGITDVGLRDYFLGCIGMLPGTVLYVYIGSLASSLATLGSPTLEDGVPAINPWLQWGVRAVGLAATLGVTVYVTRIARKALAESVAEHKGPNHKGAV